MTDDAPLICRKVDRGSRWYFDGEQRELARADVPADVLAELATVRNTLSVYRLRWADLPRWAAAMAAARSHLQELDWAYCRETDLVALEIEIADVLGTTPDQGVNGWHRDLVNLSGRQLAAFAERLKSEGIRRVKRPEVAAALKASLGGGWLAKADVPAPILSKLGQ